MALTRTQIQSKINTLIRQKSNYETQRSNYRTSLTYANKLISNLDSSLNNLNSSNDYLKRFFTINNKTIDGGKIEKAKTEISQIMKKLDNTIIPNINSNISSLTNNINLLSREISTLRRQLETAEM